MAGMASAVLRRMKLRQFLGVGGRTFFAGAAVEAPGFGALAVGLGVVLLSLMIPSFRTSRKQGPETRTGERPEGALPFHFLLTFIEYQVQYTIWAKKIFVQIVVSMRFTYG